MSRTQISVSAADDPNDPTRTVLTVAGVGQSFDKNWFFDGQYDQNQVIANLALLKQVNGSLAHIASDAFRAMVNGRGMSCPDKTRFLSSVTQTNPGMYSFQIGSTVDAADQPGFELDQNALDQMTAPLSIDQIAGNVKTFLRYGGLTSMTAEAYAAINAQMFWQ